MKNYETLADALSDLRGRGYNADFATESVCLYCGDLDLRLDPEDFHIDEVHRFEGNCKPEENTVLYAISASSGVRGTLVDPYGARGGGDSCELPKPITTLLRIDQPL
ncbi:hypothetical protein A4H97_15235 [Niastella yeongjuensis]|uniref:Phosphoribosylpyrophosphate synthetase n=1 Tax=Niastella yeongjuensis TaxID=354355 RepID=A0A1V9E4C9_9BACT|nr:phosphoribosylpyrophosphate synthetase [Niastella yeongjuensis]OQP40956.1 hypothetical protein A4H97_15235 [Niastella yeongjuensis]SEO96680.1 hypothetical protein SAMN05660816_04003 [Niastella yeongjuensis]